MTAISNPATRRTAIEDPAATAVRRVALSGDQLRRLSAAMEDGFTLDGLRQVLRTGLDGDLSVALDSIVAVEGRTLHDICYDLVLWALRDERVGLQRLLAAAHGSNPENSQLDELQQEWAGVTFTAPACPYPGMKPFTTAERTQFFGRDAEIAQSVDRLRRHPFLAVIGPSGSGKSSLLAAGILPTLTMSHHFADKTWIVRTLRPGAVPFATLSATLGMGAPPGAPAAASEAAGNGGGERLPGIEAGTRMVLIVDQYEELFTVASTDQRSQFELALRKLMGGPEFYLVIAARADFYANLMASPLWEQIREHRLEIAPPRSDALRQAIAQPARDVGVELQPELVERLMADAGEEPGVLPFVQETLVMLWAHADRYVIGLDAYTNLVGDKSGRSGLQVALAEHADDVYRSVLTSEAERAVAKRILLRLIQFGEGRADTRRQQTADELRKGISEADSFESVLAMMTANRLVTLSDEARRVDISHEALIRGWPRLRDWIDRRRVAELTRRRLEEKAGERLRLGQGKEGEGGLLDAVELAEAEAWVNGPDAVELGVSDELAALVGDSRRAIDEALQEKEAAATRLLVAAERLRRRNQGLALALVAALVAVAVAVLFYSSAQNEARNARNAEAAAQANAAEAENQRATAEANSAEAARQQATAIASAVEADNQRSAAEANALEAERAARRAQASELATYAQNAIAVFPNDPSLALLLAISSVDTTRYTDNYITTNADRARCFRTSVSDDASAQSPQRHYSLCGVQPGRQDHRHGQ